MIIGIQKNIKLMILSYCIVNSVLVFKNNRMAKRQQKILLFYIVFRNRAISDLLFYRSLIKFF